MIEKKLNDIYEGLDENINLSNILSINKIQIKEKFTYGIKDIEKNLNLLDIKSNKYIKIYKNKTKNFDSFLADKKLKNIDISNNPSFIEKFNTLLKVKIDNFINKKNTIKLLKPKNKLLGKENIFLTEKTYFNKKFYKKIIIIFISIILFFGLDIYLLQSKIKSGYTKIISIKDNSGDISKIQKNINDAKLDFIIADILIRPLLLIPNNNIKNGYYLIKGGKNLTKLLDSGVQSYISINRFINSKGGINKVKITNLLNNFKGDLEHFNNLLYNVILSYNKVNNLGNEALNIKLKKSKEKLLQGYKILNTINNDFDNFLGLLGKDKEKKYLIVFQNNDEIRPTGGFIGSLAQINIKDGKIINFAKDDVYAYEWEINKVYKNKQKAPKGLDQITKTFGLRDANYFINFEDSSNSIEFFLKKIGKDVDGIVYINQNIILDLLKLTGAIYFDKLGKNIDENNFSLLISTLVEAQSFKVGTLGTPKQILFDFANIFLDKLINDKNYISYINLLMKEFKSRDLVIYSFNSEENNLLWKLGLNGYINYGNSLDFNYPVYTSIGGNKSDRYIKIKYNKNIKYNLDCSIDTNLTIYRSHLFTKSEKNKVNNLLNQYKIKDKTRRDIINIQGAGDNKVYIRIVLPKDIIVEKRNGLNIKKYKNSTVVEFYMTTRQLETTSFNINYKIINKNCENYSFTLYKQPGIRNYSLNLKENNNSIYNSIVDKDFKYIK